MQAEEVERSPMIKSIIDHIKKVSNALFWGFCAIFSADMALEACQGIVHPIRGNELEPDPEKVFSHCKLCNTEIMVQNGVLECDCGNSNLCEDCRVKCAYHGCLQDGCKSCMYRNKELADWFCKEENLDGTVTSVCFAKYLGVAEVIISRKE